MFNLRKINSDCKVLSARPNKPDILFSSTQIFIKMELNPSCSSTLEISCSSSLPGCYPTMCNTPVACSLYLWSRIIISHQMGMEISTDNLPSSHMGTGLSQREMCRLHPLLEAVCEQKGIKGNSSLHSLISKIQELEKKSCKKSKEF